MTIRAQARSVILAGLSAALMLAAVSSAPSASAVLNIQVTTTADDTTADCQGSNACSLRGAITRANTSANVGGPDTITVPAGAYILDEPNASSEEDGNVSGDLDIKQAVNITGPSGARVTTVDGSGPSLGDRTIEVACGCTVNISGLTITGGAGAEGAGLRTAPNSTVSLTEVIVRDNDSSGPGGGIGSFGKKLTITRSTISGNSGTAGAGIYVSGASADLNLSTSTVSGNSGDGLASALDAGTTIASTTFAANANGLNNVDGSADVSLNFTILWNAGDNCLGADPLSNGRNLESGTTCGLNSALGDGDISNDVPGLGPLKNNGGATNTHAIVAAPAQPAHAMNSGGTSCPGFDQRGVARYQGTACDIGAYEARVCYFLPETHAGTEGNDKLTGTDGNDVIVGLGGNDVINAKGGDDKVCAGAGDDKMTGGPGNDTMNGDDGVDRVLFAGSTGVTINLGNQSGGNSVLGNDTFNSVEDASGSSAADTITGSGGANKLFGLGGNDIIKGSYTDDLLDGGSGNDRLDGGGGSDTCKGGSGSDTGVSCETASSL